MAQRRTGSESSMDEEMVMVEREEESKWLMLSSSDRKSVV